MTTALQDLLPVGSQETFTKTVSESDVYMFAGITGDFDPTHVDAEFCATTKYGKRIAHGGLVAGYMSTPSSHICRGLPATIVSLGYDRIRFIRPVFIGDTITVTYTIASNDPETSRIIADVKVTNQLGELVAVATHVQKAI